MEDLTLAAHAIDSWSQDLLHDAIHDLWLSHRSRGVYPHTTRIGTRVSFANAFVVLGRWERDDRIAIGKGEDRDLWTFEVLLDDDLISYADMNSKTHLRSGF